MSEQHSGNLRFAAAHVSALGFENMAEQSDDAARPVSIATQLQEGLETALETVDLAIVFASSHFAPDLSAIGERLQSTLRPRVMLACTAESVVTSDLEIENTPAITLLAGQLPGVQLTPFRLSAKHLSEWATLLSDSLIFSEAIGAPQAPKCFILLSDPFTVPIDAAGDLGVSVLQAFNDFFPGVPVVGGIASGGSQQGDNVLLLNDLAADDGLVGVALAGDIDVTVIVSQGCRPIGKPYAVTSAGHNKILSLDGERPMDVVHQMVEALAESDRHLLQTGGLYIGRAVRRLTSEEDLPGRGDFLIRGVLGADTRTGGLMIGDTPEPGEIIQFHVRDAETAIEDLELSLAPQVFSEDAAGGLLFTCNGRGTRLFDTPNGDISIVQRHVGSEKPAPFAGFFCAGEIGPIGKQNYLHGHTASMVIFRSIQS